MFKRFFIFIWEFVKVAAISLAIIIPVRYFLIQPFYVKGASMEPTFHDQEYLIIDEISYRFNEPVRGQVIVFRYPLDPQEYFIKRIIALPNESVQIKDGQVYIFNKANPDGFALKEDYLPKDLNTYSANDQKIALGSSEYYVLGDNRNASKDSRIFGPLDKKWITGRVYFRGYPFSKISVFNSTPKY